MATNDPNMVQLLNTTLPVTDTSVSLQQYIGRLKYDMSTAEHDKTGYNYSCVWQTFLISHVAYIYALRMQCCEMELHAGICRTHAHSCISCDV